MNIEKILNKYPLAIEYSIDLMNKNIQELKELIEYFQEAKSIVNRNSNNIYGIEILIENLTPEYREEYAELQDKYDLKEKGIEVRGISEQEDLCFELDNLMADLRYEIKKMSNE